MTRAFTTRVRVLALLAVGAIAGGCETLRALTADMDKPSASIRGVELRGLTLEEAELAFDVEVTNPYAATLPVASIGYALSSGDRAFLEGTTELEESIPANGSGAVTLPARVRFADAMAVLSSVRPGSVIPYTADLAIGVDAPALGRIELPVSRTSELPVPAVPRVALDGVAWTRLGLQEATATVRMRVENPHDFRVKLAGLDYDLALAGQPVGRATVSEAASFAPGGAQVLEIPLSIAPSSLGLAFLNVLRGEGADYDLAGVVRFESAYGPLELPFERAGRVPFTR